jgi:hypothetical protein
MVVWLDLHGSQIHNRIFPYLRVDKAPEGKAENPLQHTFNTEKAVPVHSTADQIAIGRNLQDRIKCHRESFRDPLSNLATSLGIHCDNCVTVDLRNCHTTFTNSGK